MVPPARGFNSRAREGRDQGNTFSQFVKRSFNSRAREGRDTLSSMLSPLTPCFNSRAREGRDAELIVIDDLGKEFQLTRPRGARLASLLPKSGADGAVSTHAPARGAT